ncbi:MAG: hypothetical protein QNJ97_09865 [Myxococcota bacterium]|nr:hypothetical protein [Myxococcota bacterium]
MKCMWGLLLLICIFGCSAATARAPVTEQDGASKRALPAGANGAPTTLEATESSTSSAPSPIGVWENASCGDRKFNRQITFLTNGRFAAIDQVAPCPPDETCVWSGIIEWHGTWKINGRLILIDVATTKAGKMPEQLPDGFVVLTESPLSIGERNGPLVCPYQQR